MTKWSTLAMIFILAGCVVGPTYRSPTTKVPEHWIENPGEPNSAQALKSFWTSFEDPILTHLIQQAIESNYDLKIAEIGRAHV